MRPIAFACVSASSPCLCALQMRTLTVAVLAVIALSTITSAADFFPTATHEALSRNAPTTAAGGVATAADVETVRVRLYDSATGVSAGLVEGSCSVSMNVCQFLGVGFAEPPTGSLRWTPAVPVASSTIRTYADALSAGEEERAIEQGPNVVHAADTQPPSCTQSPGYYDPQSEDCLYLNIFVPASHLKASLNGPANASLPVMFWVRSRARTAVSCAPRFC
jgi:hypothetical protein